MKTKSLFLGIATLFILATFAYPPVTHPSSPNIVISQVYGGGGNSGASYKNDFIELLNRGDAAVDVTEWTIQYASANGSSWDRTALSGTIAPGHYYLIQEHQGT